MEGSVQRAIFKLSKLSFAHDLYKSFRNVQWKVVQCTVQWISELTVEFKMYSSLFHLFVLFSLLALGGWLCVILVVAPPETRFATTVHGK